MVYGYVLAGGVAVSYIGCAPLFILSGIEYGKGLDAMKAKAVMRSSMPGGQNTKLNLTDDDKNRTTA